MCVDTCEHTHRDMEIYWHDLLLKSRLVAVGFTNLHEKKLFIPIAISAERNSIGSLSYFLAVHFCLIKSPHYFLIGRI